MTERLIVAHSGEVLAHDVRRAHSARDRSRGLLGTRSLPPGTAFLMELALPVGQVHTFGMRYAIDVLWLDRDWVVKRVARAMAPWRLSPPVIGARRVVELRAGSLAPLVEPGVRLRIVEGDGRSPATSLDE